MEKKRNAPPSIKRRKIETSEDAVKNLDSIKDLEDIGLDDLLPLSPPISPCDFGITGETKLPPSFFQNHTKTKNFSSGEVYATIFKPTNIEDPLTDDLISLIKSHDRWENLCYKILDKCKELRSENEMLKNMS